MKNKVALTILIAVLVFAAVFGGIGYFAYKAGQKSSTSIQQPVTEATKIDNPIEDVPTPMVSKTETKINSTKTQPKSIVTEVSSPSVATSSNETNTANASYTPAEVAQSVVCKTEVPLSTLPPSTMDNIAMGAFFTNVIASNPPLSNLESLKSLLEKWRNNYIDNIGDPDLYGSGVAYTAEELDAMDEAYEPINDMYVNYLTSWISVTNKIITDKENNGCINQNLDYFLAN